MRSAGPRGGRPRRAVAALVTVTAAFLLLPSGNAAAKGRVLTWNAKGVSKSRFVDPKEISDHFYNEPPGVKPRPNALRANVYLPHRYDARSKRRYPVVWLLHGQGDAYDRWLNPEKGRLLEILPADFPAFIVMPEADRGQYANWWNGGRRGEPAWERYHLDQLVFPAAWRGSRRTPQGSPGS